MGTKYLWDNRNLEAIDFIKEMNTIVYREFPDIQTIAEDSSDFPKVTKPIYDGGLGFGMKWMMGWMHDTLKYFKEDPIARKNIIIISLHSVQCIC